MKQELPDDEENARARTLCEQCWLAPLCLLFWGLIVYAVCHGCTAHAGEVKIAWDANTATDQVTRYLVRVEDFTGEVVVTGETAATNYTIPFVPRGTDLIITLVAVNAKGPSGPAIITHRYPFKIRLTDQRSSDLKTWTDGRAEEITTGNKGFFRLKIENVP